jgi:hypothetical protein
LLELEETRDVVFGAPLETEDDGCEEAVVDEVTADVVVAFATIETKVVAGTVPGTSVGKFWTTVP